MKIEPAAALALQAVIENDLRLMGEMNRQLDALAEGGIDERDVVTMAYSLHNLYSVLENSFGQISRTFEITSSNRRAGIGNCSPKYSSRSRSSGLPSSRKMFVLCCMRCCAFGISFGTATISSSKPRNCAPFMGNGRAEAAWWRRLCELLSGL